MAAQVKPNMKRSFILTEAIMKKKKLDLIFPGTILLEEFMEPLGITAYKLSKGIKVQQTAIGQIIRGRRRITADMALRLSRFFGNSAQFWLNLQNNYDLEAVSEKKEYLFNGITPYSQVAEKTAVYASV
jgi:addiction module HigA family antidote